MERGRSSSAYDQSQLDHDSTETARQRVIDLVRRATLECLPQLSQADRDALDTDFWPAYVVLMEQFGPEVTKQIFSRAKEIDQERVVY